MAEYPISAFLTCRKAKTSERIDNTIETNTTNEKIYSTNVQVGLTAQGRGVTIEKIALERGK